MTNPTSVHLGMGRQLEPPFSGFLKENKNKKKKNKEEIKEKRYRQIKNTEIKVTEEKGMRKIKKKIKKKE